MLLLDLPNLRKQMRKKRRQVGMFEHRQTAQAILAKLRAFPQLQHACHVGIYLDAFGEVQTRAIILWCFEQGKSVYLPIVCPLNEHLVWGKISRQQYMNQRFQQHPLGMKEPHQSRGLHMKHLDLVLMPLLIADAHGTRVGMGGGYYDRSLSRCPQKPIRVGLSHDFQMVEGQLPRQVWDQPLDYLVTSRKFYHFRKKYKKSSNF